jgi:hypothetical protein
MTDDEVLDGARAEGFEFIERDERRPVGGRLGTR